MSTQELPIIRTDPTRNHLSGNVRMSAPMPKRVAICARAATATSRPIWAGV